MTSEYAVTVITGIRKGAGTDSSVSLIIKGNTLTHYCHKVIISLSGLGYPTWCPGPATQIFENFNQPFTQ